MDSFELITGTQGAEAIELDSAGASEIEREVLSLFDEFRDSLLRYAISFGLQAHDAEEIVQETFLLLFRHLQLGKSKKNLRGWIFRVVHNLSLKDLYAKRRMCDLPEDEATADRQIDPMPDPEELASFAQRRIRILAVVDALAENDRSCLLLRAEGLSYREIASVLGVSLGSVSISLTRSLARLTRAERSKPC
jgi:RNA polymerase sigma-70 factor (ECF subfamily)